MFDIVVFGTISPRRFSAAILKLTGRLSPSLLTREPVSENPNIPPEEP